MLVSEERRNDKQARRDKFRKKRRFIVTLIVALVVVGCIYWSLPHQVGGGSSDRMGGWLSRLLENLPFSLAAEEISTTLENSLAQVHMLDVGQGESILIQTAESTVLIDSGERATEQAVLDFLKQQRVEYLDIVIVTHPHSDHMGAMAKILREIPVGRIILPEIPDELVPTTQVFTDLLETIKARKLRITPAKAGDSYDLAENITLTVLAPLSGKYKSLNDYSVVSRLKVGEVSFLFTGDIEGKAEKAILSAGENITADVLNIAHHGSNSSTAQSFFHRVNPSIALISCGLDNSYGHPHREVLERISEANAAVYRTDRQGRITVETDGERLVVVFEKQGTENNNSAARRPLFWCEKPKHMGWVAS